MSVINGSHQIPFIGRSEAIRRLEQDATEAARCEAKVLITGETGAGKEVIARLIHQRSRRSRAALVALNCGGIPDSLLESELFGHVRGSFTGAYRDTPGLLESASNGTLFLDEIGEMSARMQSLLLRFLESGEIQRVGADRAHTWANVRLIAATNRDLQAQMLTGGFRQDLYFRLHVIHLCVPPLRDRAEDIPLLVQHFLKESGQLHGVRAPEISACALAALAAYEWPGNVRELRNVIERLVLKAGGQTVREEDLPIDRRPRETTPAPPRRDPTADHEARAGDLVSEMVERGESFWLAVHPRFMARDLTRNDLRAVIRIGLGAAGGNYRVLVRRFNMPASDYKRFLRFLRVHDCHLSFHEFRSTGFNRASPADRGQPELQSA